MTPEVRKEMRRGIVLALGLLFTACSASAVLNRDTYSYVRVTNAEWEHAVVQFYCNGNQLARIRVQGMSQRETYLALGRCSDLGVRVHYVGNAGADRAHMAPDLRIGLIAGHDVYVDIPNCSFDCRDALHFYTLLPRHR